MKKIVSFFIIFVVILMLTQVSFASSKGTTTSKIFDDTNLQTIKDGVSNFNTDSGIGGAINTIIGLLQVAGTGISVITVTMLGIKYLMASVSDKAEIKKQAVPIVIGCVLLFGAVNIMAIVENFANKSINAE